MALKLSGYSQRDIEGIGLASAKRVAARDKIIKAVLANPAAVAAMNSVDPDWEERASGLYRNKGLEQALVNIECEAAERRRT